MKKKEPFEFYLNRYYTRQTVKSYVFTVSNFIKNHPNAGKFQHKDIVSYLADLGKTIPSVVTRNTMLCAIKKYYDYLIAIKTRNDHPCKTMRIKGENIAKRTQVQFQELYTAQELEALLDRENRYRFLELRNKLIISFLIYQGLTCEEITQLNMGNIDYDAQTVYIKPTRRLRSRTVQLKPNQIIWLHVYLKHHRNKLAKTPTKRLFIGIRGDSETVEGIGGMLEPLKTLYPERPLSAQAIRMSVIANWINISKLPIDKVQYLAGHKWPSSSLKYKRIDLNIQR